MKTYLFFIFIAIQSFAQPLPVDEQFEERLARINSKFNQSEISEEEWAQVAGEKISENYNLQEGDTLWDISEKFFGNGFYWPKIWQLNDEITNPHMVKVGSTLKFSAGSITTPPQLGVEGGDVNLNMSESEEAPADTEEIAVQDESEPNEVVKNEIIIPKGRSQVEPLEVIPDSFPEWRETFGEFDEDGFALENQGKGRDFQSQSFVSEVIADGPWKSNGLIYETDEEDKKSTAMYQNLFIKLEAGSAPGELFTVFKNGEKILDPATKEEVGTQIIIKGLISIKKPVGGVSDTYLATVRKTINPIEVGDTIIAGNYMVKATYDVTGAESVVSAKIIDGDGTKRRVFGLHNVVYLDKGEKDGVQVDTLLNVVKNMQLRKEKSKIKSDDEVIGKLKVVNVGQNVATAIVVKSSDAIRTGDETAQAQASESSEPSESEPIPDAEIPEE